MFWKLEVGLHVLSVEKSSMTNLTAEDMSRYLTTILSENYLVHIVKKHSKTIMLLKIILEKRMEFTTMQFSTIEQKYINELQELVC